MIGRYSLEVLEWAYLDFPQLVGIGVNSSKLRKWINAAFPNNPLLHQHELSTGKPLFIYPRVQYKVLKGIPVVYGLMEGVEVIEEIFYRAKNGEVRLGPMVISSASMRKGATLLREVESTSYSLLTPWLAFNKENYQSYSKAGNWVKRKKIINSIMVGNILSMAKTFDITIDFHLRVRSKVDRTFVKIPNHELGAVAFYGDVEMNIDLPPFIGLGRHVSLGYGTLRKTGGKSDWTW
jgi:hypothetical protein